MLTRLDDTEHIKTTDDDNEVKQYDLDVLFRPRRRYSTGEMAGYSAKRPILHSIALLVQSLN